MTTQYEQGVKNRATATEFYNANAAKVGLKPIKSFKDTATALGRASAVEKLLAGGVGKKEDAAKPTGEKKAKRTGGAGRKSSTMPDDSTIKVVKTENPKRPNTKAHAKYGKLIEADGLTVKEFKAKEGRTPTLDEEVGWPSVELRYAIKQGWVKLEKAKASE